MTKQHVGIVGYAIGLLRSFHKKEKDEAFARTRQIRAAREAEKPDAETDYDLGFWEGQHSAYTQIERQLDELYTVITEVRRE